MAKSNMTELAWKAEEAKYKAGKLHIVLRIRRDGNDVCQLCGKPVEWVGDNTNGSWQHKQ